MHSGRTCDKDWSYTRVIQYEFVGAANEEVRDVQSRLKHEIYIDFRIHENRFLMLKLTNHFFLDQPVESYALARPLISAGNCQKSSLKIISAGNF